MHPDVIRRLACAPRLTNAFSHHPALYEADKKAHEEAVQNGGVRLATSFPTLQLIVRVANRLFLLYFVCRAAVDPVLVWDPTPHDEP